MSLSDPTTALATVRKTTGQRAAAREPALARERRSARVLKASGMRMDTSSAKAMMTVAGNRQPWQAQAWGYRDLIGELRYAMQYRARAISRVQFMIAQVSGTDDEPIAVSLRNDEDQEKAERVTVDPDLCEAAEFELSRLPLDAGYSFLGVYSENQDVAGECWLHGWYDEDGEECWRIRSVDEVTISADGRTVNLMDDFTGGPGRRVNLEEEELYRLWVPHPRRGYLADSALRAMLGTLEDIVLVGREVRAAARSRIMANGVLKVPHGMTMLNNVRDESGDDDESDENRFVSEFTAALLAPIANEGDAGSVVPLMVTGDIEDLESFQHLRLEREDSEQLTEKLEKFLARMANGLDIPPEILTGMADVNHWTAWQIDSSTARHHIEPSVRLMADSLTAAFLRPALKAWGFPTSEIKKLRIWYDLGSLTENPNRRQDAIDARKERAIGDAAFRQALGFNDEDAPTPAEVLNMIAGTAGMDQATAWAIMRWFAEQQDGGDLELPEIGTPAAMGAPALAPRAISPAGPGQPAGSTPDSGDAPPPAQTPSAPPGMGVSGRDPSIIHSGRESVLTAAAPPDTYQLAFDQARQLMEVDRALRGTITAAAEAALTRALERAGARMRGKATADRELSATLKAIPSQLLPQHLGQERCFALGGTEAHLLADAFDELADKFKALVTLGISAIIDRVLKMLGLKRDQGRGKVVAKRMESAMTGRMDDGWQWMHGALLDRARKRLFGGDDDDQPGELSEGEIPPYIIRGAMALIGGLPETSGGLDEYGRSLTGEPVGGLANGDSVTREIEAAGGTTVGYLWVYGVTPQKRRFDPHWDLEGERFATWDDPKLDTADVHSGRFAWVGDSFRPGDHRGCMCDYVPGYAIPAYGEQVRQRLAVPTQGMADIIALAEGDDAAGREGTTAQELRDQHAEIQKLQNRFLKGAA